MDDKKPKLNNYYNLKNANFLRNRIAPNKEFPVFSSKYLLTNTYQNLSKSKIIEKRLAKTTTKFEKSIENVSDSQDSSKKKNIFKFFREKVEKEHQSSEKSKENFQKDISKIFDLNTNQSKLNENIFYSKLQILSQMSNNYNNENNRAYIEDVIIPKRESKSQPSKYKRAIREKTNTKHEKINENKKYSFSNILHNFSQENLNESRTTFDNNINKKTENLIENDIEIIDFESILKKDLPNCFSNIPFGRKDVIFLKNWFENQLLRINFFKKDKVIDEIYIKKCKELFDLIVNEIIRELKYECIERGQLLLFIWNHGKQFQREQINFFNNNTLKIKEKEIEEMKKLERSALENIQIAYKDRDAYREKYYQSSVQNKVIEGELEKNLQIQKNQTIKLEKYKNKIKKMKIEIIKYKHQFIKNKELIEIRKNVIKNVNKSNFNTPLQSEENISSEDENNFEIKINEGINTNVHKIDILNNIIIHTVPEVPKKFYSEKETEVTPDLYLEFCKSSEVVTDIQITEDFKIFENIEEFQNFKAEVEFKAHLENFLEDPNDNLKFDSNEEKVTKLIFSLKEKNEKTGIDLNLDEKFSLDKLEDLKYLDLNYNGESTRNRDSPLKVDTNFSETLETISPTKSGNKKKSIKNVNKYNSPKKKQSGLIKYEDIIENLQQEIDSLKIRNRKVRLHISIICKILQKLSETYKFNLEKNKNLEQNNKNLKNSINELENENSQKIEIIEKMLAEKNNHSIHIEKLVKENHELFDELEKYRQQERERNEKNRLEQNKNMIKEHKKRKENTNKRLISPLQVKKKKKELDNDKKERQKEQLSSRRNLGEKVHIEYEHQKRDIARQLVEKIKQRKLTKFRNYMHLKLIFKQITVIYTTRLQHYQDLKNSKQDEKISEMNDFDMATYTYTKYMNHFRINMFGRFLGLLDYQTNYTTEECNKYIEALEYILYQSTMGTSNTIANNESDDQFLVSYLKALQYLSHYDNKMCPEEFHELKSKIEKLKDLNDKEEMINFDLFMYEILTKYRALVNRAKTYVINAFAACDLDGNGICNYEEFTLLNRHIEADSFDEEKLENMFFENADIDDDGEKNLSFDKFSIVCVEHNLFSDERQNLYLGITNKNELNEKFIKLKEEWPDLSKNIKKRFEGLTVISKEEIDKWLEICEVLNNRIMENMPNEVKPLLIAFNILDKESIMLCEDQVEYDENIVDN